MDEASDRLQQLSEQLKILAQKFRELQVPALAPKVPAIPVILIERYWCQDSILVVYILETGDWYYILTSYN